MVAYSIVTCTCAFQVLGPACTYGCCTMFAFSIQYVRDFFWQWVVYAELWMQIPSGGLFVPSTPDWRLEIGQWDICQMPHLVLVVSTVNVLFETLPSWRKLLLLLGSLLKHTDYGKNIKYQRCYMAYSPA